VEITDPAIIAAATLSHRYITDRQLPDKAIDLIDEAASRIRMEIDSKPEVLDRLERRLIQLKIEREALKKETDEASKKRLATLQEEIDKLEKEYADLEEIWQAEKAALQGTTHIKEELERARIELEAAQRAGDLARMSELQYGKIPELEKQLEMAAAAEMSEMKLLKNKVGEEEIAEVVSRWTGIPVSKMLESEREKLLHMEDELARRVVGQHEAILAVSNAIRRSRAGLADPNRPNGSFLFLGPTGVGKTELTKALTEFLFDTEDAIVRIDMSEFMEKHSVARLVGAPPGYVGYEEGGYLTEAVRRRPYSVVLLDEVEKAHPDVFNILLQVLDDGRLTDGQGRTVDFRNTVIIMTSNLGSEQIQAMAGEENYEAMKAAVMVTVGQYFRPEFINRIDETVVFHPLGKEEIRTIARIQLNNLEERLRDSVRLALKLGKGLLYVQQKGSDQLIPLSTRLMEVETGLAYEDPSPNSFSFNSPYGACKHCRGLGTVSEVDVKKVIPQPSKTIREGGIAPWGAYRNNRTFSELKLWLRELGTDFDTPIEKMPKDALRQLLEGEDGMLGVYTTETQAGVLSQVRHWYYNSSSEKIRRWAEGFMSTQTCPECGGYRLQKESLYFKIGGLHIGQVAEMDLPELKKWLNKLPKVLDKRRRAIAAEIVKELKLRLQFLLDVGLDYLSLNRPARTLSGGESQRIRLATQIGSKLTGITYILDEPSIGLHQRDNARLLETLTRLRDLGNTVIVVEHDEDAIRTADHVLDIGPGAGVHGGEIVAQGTPEEIMANPASLTGQYLTGALSIPVPKKRRRPEKGRRLRLVGARGNNLKNLTVDFPLGVLTCVTGVSGSGKSTLTIDTLYAAAARRLMKARTTPAAHERLEGLEMLDKIIDIDQSPIGRTPRSNPATYTGAFTPIREWYAGLPEAKARGYGPGRFSFNVKGGRCEACKGDGVIKIEMHFLPDVYVTCEECGGSRYNRETLQITWKGKSIADVLDMTVAEAAEFFSAVPSVRDRLRMLERVGLGYVKVGQPATTLSGGEAQRVKLARELSRRATGRTLYILDEPTTGLHFHDVAKLLDVLHELVEQGNTVIVIEHNLDVIKTADWIIDLGPEGGTGGGELVIEGTPEDVAACEASWTGRYLAPVLNRRKTKAAE